MLNAMEMDRYIKSTAARGDLSVQWYNGQPKTDGKTIWLPRLDAGASDMQYKQLRHYATGEVNRNLFSSFKGQWAPVTPDRSLLGAIHNVVEGYRTEYLGVQGYEGDRQCSNEVRPELVRSVLKNIDKAPPGAADSVLPLLAWSNRKYTEMYPSCLGVQEELERRMSPQAKALYTKLCAGNYDNAVDAVRNVADKDKGTAATYDVAKRIFEEVYGQDSKKEEERCKQEEKKGSGKPDDKANAGKGDEGKGEGKGKESADKGEGESSGDHGEGDKARTKEVRCDYTELIPEGRATKGRTTTPMHFNIPENYRGSGTYEAATPDLYSVEDYTKGGIAGGGGGYTQEINKALRKCDPAFGHRVRTILQVRDRDHYQYGLKRGKLNVGSLHRIVVKDAPGYNERVFKRREENNVLDAAVSLLVDQSGSMGGDKYTHAATAAVMLNDIIGNVLHIPVEIASFTTGYNYTAATAGKVIPKMYVMRTFKDKLLPSTELVARFARAADEGMCNNPDGDAVMWVFDRLMQRREKRKLLIVFSDGQPAGGNGDCIWHLKHVVKNIEQHSPVSIVGIGLQDRSVKMFYKEHQVITDVSQLEHALLEVIEGKLK